MAVETVIVRRRAAESLLSQFARVARRSPANTLSPTTPTTNSQNISCRSAGPGGCSCRATTATRNHHGHQGQERMSTQDAKQLRANSLGVRPALGPQQRISDQEETLPDTTAWRTPPRRPVPTAWPADRPADDAAVTNSVSRPTERARQRRSERHGHHQRQQPPRGGCPDQVVRNVEQFEPYGIDHHPRIRRRLRRWESRPRRSAVPSLARPLVRRQPAAVPAARPARHA